MVRCVGLCPLSDWRVRLVRGGLEARLATLAAGCSVRRLPGICAGHRIPARPPGPGQPLTLAKNRRDPEPRCGFILRVPKLSAVLPPVSALVAATGRPQSPQIFFGRSPRTHFDKRLTQRILSA